MKKLLIAFVMMLGLTFTSCGVKSNTETVECNCDSICTCDSACTCCVDTVDPLTVDTIASDSIQ